MMTTIIVPIFNDDGSITDWWLNFRDSVNATMLNDWPTVRDDILSRHYGIYLDRSSQLSPSSIIGQDKDVLFFIMKYS